MGIIITAAIQIGDVNRAVKKPPQPTRLQHLPPQQRHPLRQIPHHVIAGVIDVDASGLVGDIA